MHLFPPVIVVGLCWTRALQRYHFVAVQTHRGLLLLLRFVPPRHLQERDAMVGASRAVLRREIATTDLGRPEERFEPRRFERGGNRFRLCPPHEVHRGQRQDQLQRRPRLRRHGSKRRRGC